MAAEVYVGRSTNQININSSLYELTMMKKGLTTVVCKLSVHILPIFPPPSPPPAPPSSIQAIVPGTLPLSSDSGKPNWDSLSTLQNQ